jgi:hypothetical protein
MGSKIAEKSEMLFSTGNHHGVTIAKRETGHVINLKWVTEASRVARNALDVLESGRTIGL